MECGIRPPIDGDSLLGMEIDFRAYRGCFRVSGRSLIGMRRHLEPISCGIPAESGPIEPPESAKPPELRVNPGASANDGTQTS
jgi:hypothetical protein